MATAVDETTAKGPEQALEPEAATPAETDTGEVAQAEEATGDGEGELVVSIGEEAPPQDETQSAPQWVRDLRKRDRENTRRIKELEAKLAEKEQPAVAALPPKPTLEGCDYDADEFERKLTAWHETKREIDAKEAATRKQQEEADKAWQAKVASYQEAKGKLPAADVDDAEQAVIEALGNLHTNILVDGADNPALLIYALGKNPAKLKELAEVKHSASRFAFKAAKIEAEVKVSKRTAKPAPEAAITGTAPGGVAGSDATLERLRAEAERTGDFSKVVAYKRQLRAA